jgi:crotonobetainyl-CoA:carnitine CoA-transferase CaiB-like acyl-CoA transferase
MPLFAVQATGQAPAAQQALLNGGVPCYRTYRTLDGRHMAVGALELKFWQTFCTALTRPDWAVQHWSLGSHVAGDSAAQALSQQVASLIASKPLSYWETLFKGVDCCATPVLRMDEALQHPANLAYGNLAHRNAHQRSVSVSHAPAHIPTIGSAIRVMA